MAELPVFRNYATQIEQTNSDKRILAPIPYWSDVEKAAAMTLEDLNYPIVCFASDRPGTFSVVKLPKYAETTNSLSMKHAIEHSLIWIDSAGDVYDTVAFHITSKGRIRDFLDKISNSPVRAVTEVKRRDEPMSLTDFTARILSEFADPNDDYESWTEAGLRIPAFKRLVAKAQSIREIIAYLARYE